MHDGQNLFDNNLASFGKSWGIMEAYSNDSTIPEVIIVGVDSGVNRTEELVPFVFNNENEKELHGGNSDEYYNFITKTLKTFIDNRYRTFKSAKNTGIMGSSYGGLSSTYAVLKYSEFFSRFGCISNAYFPVQNELENLIEKSDLSSVKKFYMDVGSKESSTDEKCEKYIISNQAIYELIFEKLSSEKLRFEIIEDAIHHESAWEARFPEIMKFLFND